MAPAKPKTPSGRGRGRPPKKQHSLIKPRTAETKTTADSSSPMDNLDRGQNRGEALYSSPLQNTPTAMASLTPIKRGRGRPPKIRKARVYESEEEIFSTPPTNKRPKVFDWITHDVSHKIREAKSTQGDLTSTTEQHTRLNVESEGTDIVDDWFNTSDGIKGKVEKAIELTPSGNSATTSTGQIQLPTHKISRFLQLPLVVKNKIYEELLVVGRVYPFPCSEDFEITQSSRDPRMLDPRYKEMTTAQVPELQILRLCRQIKEEGERIYLEKNHFVLPRIAAQYVLPCRSIFLTKFPKGIERPWSLPSSAVTYLRSLSITFDFRDEDKKMAAMGMHMSGGLPGNSDFVRHPGNVTEDLHDKWIHDARMGELKQRWAQFYHGIGYCSLDLIQIDISRCYCPLGCHRMVFEALQVALPSALSHSSQIMPPKKVEIIGVLDAEKSLVFERLRNWSADKVVLLSKHSDTDGLLIDGEGLLTSPVYAHRGEI